MEERLEPEEARKEDEQSKEWETRHLQDRRLQEDLSDLLNSLEKKGKNMRLFCRRLCSVLKKQQLQTHKHFLKSLNQTV